MVDDPSPRLCFELNCRCTDVVISLNSEVLGPKSGFGERLGGLRDHRPWRFDVARLEPCAASRAFSIAPSLWPLRPCMELVSKGTMSRPGRCGEGFFADGAVMALTPVIIVVSSPVPRALPAFTVAAP